ncbi:MAG: glycosyltransferase family 2 protein [Candidatus Kerfeldbacteria bacterium]|nr:glycosyltransferase family 2 protein [Candidatus Kerfeldbacteria bacterium]
MINRRRVIAVLPAYNAAKTLAHTVADIPRDIVDHIIVVDDASSDDTVKISRSMGLETIVHAKNRGYGGNQKTCYAAALAGGADIVVMVHPDHQYDPRYIRQLVTLIAGGQVDAAFGSRMLMTDGARQGGMPWWKRMANVALTNMANGTLGVTLSEYHSGFRAYSRQVLQALSFEYNSDDFIFDTEIIIQVHHAGFRIGEIPIPTRYFKDASSIGFGRSVAYGLSFLQVLWRYRLHQWHWRRDPLFLAAAS